MSVPITNYCILDISTAAVEHVEQYLDPVDADSRRPPGTYTKPDTIAEWRRKDYENDRARAALDMDLARITGLHCRMDDTSTHAIKAHYVEFKGLAKDETEEIALLRELRRHMTVTQTLISYNGLSFDWPLLMRRARYLGVDFPVINCDRYRSPHKDILAILSGGDPSRRRSLSFYVRRHGWADLSKPLSGAEEANVPQSGRWAELEASLSHDVEATRRLAVWLGLIA